MPSKEKLIICSLSLSINSTDFYIFSYILILRRGLEFIFSLSFDLFFIY